MMREKHIVKNRLPLKRLFCVGAAVLAMSPRPGVCQLNVFFPDTISTDTVVMASVDSFVTGKDTGLSAIKVGWTPGPVAQSHRSHEKMGLSCVTCHHKHNNDARIKQCTQCHKGIAGMQNLHNKCGQCHLYRAMDMSCTRCHKTPEKGAMQADLFKFKFSHVKHYAQKKECRFCHAEPLRAQWLKKDNYPAMKTCLSCHDSRKSSGQCSVCHNDVAQIKPRSHLYTWVGRNGHGLEADYDKDECLQCHSKKECDRCHLGQTSCRIHAPGYRFMHGTDVRMGVTNCAMCHEAKNSCGQCHENRLR